LKEPSDRTAIFWKKRRGSDPAAGAVISSANNRPYRESAAAAGNGDGRGLDHARDIEPAVPPVNIKRKGRPQCPTLSLPGLTRQSIPF
jgi:hypothetical protein